MRGRGSYRYNDWRHTLHATLAVSMQPRCPNSEKHVPHPSDGCPDMPCLHVSRPRQIFRSCPVSTRGRFFSFRAAIRSVRVRTLRGKGKFVRGCCTEWPLETEGFEKGLITCSFKKNSEKTCVCKSYFCLMSFGLSVAIL